MADPFGELLDLEDDFYKQGYDAGVADSTHAGLVEGKVFGIEKGYEKALTLGRWRGRALVWKHRLNQNQEGSETSSAQVEQISKALVGRSPPLASNARLDKHIDNLLASTDPATLPKDNSDDSVAEVDERVTKTKARAKVISTIVGEAVTESHSLPGAGIEESTGLSARH